MNHYSYKSMLFLLFVFFIASFSFGFENLYEFSWGKGQANFSTRLESCGRYGPSFFTVDGDALYILDREINTIKSFDLKSGNIISLFKVDSYTDCFAVDNDCLAFYNGIDIKICSKEGQRNTAILRKPENIMIIKSLLIRENILYAMDENAYFHSIYDIKNNKMLDPIPAIKAVYQDGSFCKGFLIKEDFHNIRLFIGCEEIPVNYEGYIGASSILYIGEKYILIRSEELFSMNPIKAEEMLLFIDHNGNIIKRIDIPFLYYTYFPDNIKVYEGILYYMLSAKDGIHAIRTSLDELVLSDQGVFISEFPEKYHYNSELKSTEVEPQKDNRRPKAENPITRSQILDNAVPYEALVWTATSSNISGGIIQLPDGSYIRTPSWVVAGSLQKVPYKWGGWTSLTTFTSQVSAGKYAGDNYTESVSWTDNYCVGVDCSGFVSRSWDTSIKYSTYTLQDISTAYSSFTELKRGDVVNKASSHVRLVISDNPSGTVNTIESAGADWRVSYRDFTFTQLADYIPRYFDYVQEDPDPLPQAFVAEVKSSVYTLNVRTGPSPSYSILTTLTGNQKFVVSDYDNGWYKLHFPSGEGYSYGWCNGGTTAENGYLTGSQATGIATVNVSSTLNVRSGPSTAYDIITTLSNGQKIALLEESGGWYRFSLPGSTGHTDGWASGTYLDITAGGPKSPVGAELISISAPSGLEINEDGTVDITLKNNGFSSFSPGTYLKTSNPQNHDSLFYHPDWINTSTVSNFSTQVLPFQQYSFSFYIHADPSLAGQTVTEYLNLYEDGLGWFSDTGQNGPADDIINFAISVGSVNITDIQPSQGIYSIGSQIDISWTCDAPSGDSMRISIKRDGYPDIEGPDYYLLTSDTLNSGSASFIIPDGINTSDDWRVWIAHNASGAFSNASGNITVKQPVTVSVSDGTNPVEAAKITIDDSEYLTNSQGNAVISLFHGNYSYHVSKSGFIYYDSSYLVDSNNTEIDIILSASTYHDLSISLENPSFEGIWLWSYIDDERSSSWTKLISGMTAESIHYGDISNDGLKEIIVDFGTDGLWYYSFSTSSWFNLSSFETSCVITAKTNPAGPSDVIASFTQYGLYRYDFQGAAWERIIQYPVSIMCSGNMDMDPDGIDELLLSFGIVDGIYEYNFQEGTFTRLLFASPSQIIASDTSGNGNNELVCSFTGIGTYIAGNTSRTSYQWNRITWGYPDAGHMICCGDVSDGPGNEVIMTYLSKTYYFCSDTSVWTLIANAPFKRIASGLFTGQAKHDLMLCSSANGDIFLRKTYFGSFDLIAASGNSNAMCSLD